MLHMYISVTYASYFICFNAFFLQVLSYESCTLNNIWFYAFFVGFKITPIHYTLIIFRLIIIFVVFAVCIYLKDNWSL